MPIAAVARGLQRAPTKVGKEEIVPLKENHHLTKIKAVLLSQAVRVRMKRKRGNLFLPNDFLQQMTEEARSRKMEFTLQKNISLCVVKGELIARKTTIELQDLIADQEILRAKALVLRLQGATDLSRALIVRIEMTDLEEKAEILNLRKEGPLTEAEAQIDQEERAEIISLRKEGHLIEAKAQIDQEEKAEIISLRKEGHLIEAKVQIDQEEKETVVILIGKVKGIEPALIPLTEIQTADLLQKEKVQTATHSAHPFENSIQSHHHPKPIPRAIVRLRECV